MNQFERFLNIENFRLAFIRLKTAQRNLYKSIYYPDLKIFEVFLEDNLTTLIRQIASNTYTPEQSHKIFIPKKNLLVRPLSMLKLTDLIVFQAIVNIIADESYDKIAPVYDNTVFGNIVNTSSASETDRIFFYRSWKKSWKRFSEKSIECYNDGYKYLSEFDIASFFDTIDHNILIEILQNLYGIDPKLTDLLKICLAKWTADFNHKTFVANHGIPQGPISSIFLADLYLMYLDEEITSKESLDIKYLRYVDDIRIFSKTEKNSRKAIAALDLISRDLGLIPQSTKVIVKEVDDIEKELKIQNNKFSNITKEYIKETDGKPSRNLKAKTHRSLKKRFIDCFNEDDSQRNEDYLDKSVIGFSLFKLNQDDEIKDLLLSKHELILTHFEGLLYYLKRHFSEDAEVKAFLNKIINDEDILFHHLVALVFKTFPELEFNEEVFERYVTNKNRNWLVRYYMVDWLFANQKHDLFELLLIENRKNYFIQREINDCKFIISKDKTFKKLFTEKLLKSEDSLLAIQGLYLSFRNLNLFIRLNVNSNQNSFVKQILGGTIDDYICTTLKNKYRITNPETFFNRTVWNDDAEYKALDEYLIAYEKFRESHPSIAILNLNSFNNLCFDKICSRLGKSQPTKEYGVNLDSKILEADYPKLTRYWAEINAKRNQKTEAHPYDKYGQISVKIDKNELKPIHTKQIDVLKEICSKRNY